MNTRAVLFISVLSLASNALAGVVSADWQATGDGLLTLDTTTGYRWLDLTVTVNQSYDFVAAQTGAGGLYQGFRTASVAEVAAFFASAGAQSSAGLDPGTVNLLNLVGTINPDNGWSRYSAGFTNTSYDPVVGWNNFSTLEVYASGECTAVAGNGAGNTSVAFTTTGTWLIQTSVPAPGAIALLGFAGLVGRRRR
jgi:hypothetical protein